MKVLDGILKVRFQHGMVRNKGEIITTSQRMLKWIGLGPKKQELKLSAFLSNLYEVEA